MQNTFNLNLPIAIGADHAGVDYKTAIITLLEGKGYRFSDSGTHGTASVDYPDFAHPVAKEVETGVACFGILICGSGNGVCMTANKHAGIRAALCWNLELAALSRQHNNANILCIPARFLSLELAAALVDTFMNTAFEGGRHENRVNKINC